MFVFKGSFLKGGVQDFGLVAREYIGYESKERCKNEIFEEITRILLVRF